MIYAFEGVSSAGILSASFPRRVACSFVARNWLLLQGFIDVLNIVLGVRMRYRYILGSNLLLQGFIDVLNIVRGVRMLYQYTNHSLNALDAD